MITRLVIYFLAVLYPSYLPAESHHWQSTEYLIQSFFEIALKNEYSSGDQVVRKWDAGIFYYFDHRVEDRELHERLARDHMRHLSEITGHSFEQTLRRQKANLTIVFSREKGMEKELKALGWKGSKFQLKKFTDDNVCFAFFFFKPKGAIERAFVLIPVDRANSHGKLVSCIVEELTQMMGLPNDSEKVFPSIFNDKSYHSLLTGLDYLLLKILYDKRMIAGMTRAEADPVIKKIVRELQQNGTVSNAQKIVGKGPLYRLLE
ncbi:MAG: DUF2927 domain-containing protein [Gammaproteobacteria bacterium]